MARGYKPGTDEFSDCVVRVDSERDQRMERNRRDMMEKPDTAPAARKAMSRLVLSGAQERTRTSTPRGAST